MLARRKLLLGAVLVTAAADVVLAGRVYTQKKAVALKDMVLYSIERKVHSKSSDADAVPIPIE